MLQHMTVCATNAGRPILGASVFLLKKRKADRLLWPGIEFLLTLLGELPTLRSSGKQAK
jgi:hypothetical protein